jgi:hypothetical protein
MSAPHEGAAAVTLGLGRWPRLLSMGAVIMAATIFGLSYSLCAPLIAMSLAADGHSGSYIGLNAAMHALGVLLIAPAMPSLAARFGARSLAVAALVSPRWCWRPSRASPTWHGGFPCAWCWAWRPRHCS